MFCAVVVLTEISVFCLFQAVDASKKEHALTLKKVKEKIISTEYVNLQ